MSLQAVQPTHAMSALQSLFARYVNYHRHGPLMLHYLSVLGFTTVPLYYLLRFFKSEPGYDDWWLRAIVASLCLVLFLRERWPARLKPFYYGYSYLVLIIGLPAAHTFMSLHHGGGPIAVANTMMAATLVMLLADWRNMVVILLSGTALGTLLYLGTTPDPHMPLGYLPRLPVLLAMLLGGSLIKHALAQATAAERVRHAYASLAGSIAHEMRNPLGQLKYSLEAIQQALPAPTARAQVQELGPEQQDAIYRHVAQGELAVQRGLQVIAMTLEEVHAKPMKPEDFRLLRAGETCAKAIQEYGYEEAAHRARISLHVECDFVFRADETAFLFVLFNLMKNALAYPGVRVHIVVDAGQVEVRDDGPGIAPEVRARLFQPFHSLGKAGGTGLGLAYCQRVMQMFGGSISCSSVLGKSTCFRLTLPLATATEREAERSAVLAKARTLFDGRRLLVVDDDAAGRFLTRHKLASIGAVVDECQNGGQALQMLAQQHYDLIVLDLNMPGLDGYALAQRIRAGQPGIDQQLCIVAYSCEPELVAQVKARKAGMDDFVAKPGEQVVLLQALCRAMEKFQEQCTAEQAPSLWGRTMLLADDNASIRKTVAASLRHAGIAVVEADSGTKAMARLATMDSCDAILLDIEMPGMDGIETARSIRASAMAWNRAPILMLTAHSAPSVMEDARRAGASDFLIKPVDMVTLLGKLRALPLAGSPFPGAPHSARLMGVETGDLLDVDRLDNHRRIGVLDELMVDYLPHIERLLLRVETATEARDMAACCDALHSLVGMSGEAGALALHRLARKCYVPMVEKGRWPEPPDWTDALRALAAETRQALTDYATPTTTIRA